ncbi:hypothetical protein ACFQS7_20400 [Dankookia sp. GCM10030260]|uniref:hypothetical protein n=1 Tax=Dankookia sp. GCM10030260 TaxID=3273390 RepID=UPI003620CAD4
MRIAVTDCASLPASGPAPGAALAMRVRRWLRQRRQAAVLRQVEPRLREDAGLPMGAAAAILAAASLQAPRGA